MTSSMVLGQNDALSYSMTEHLQFKIPLLNLAGDPKAHFHSDGFFFLSSDNILKMILLFVYFSESWS